MIDPVRAWEIEGSATFHDTRGYVDLLIPVIKCRKDDDDHLISIKRGAKRAGRERPMKGIKGKETMIIREIHPSPGGRDRVSSTSLRRNGAVPRAGAQIILKRATDSRTQLMASITVDDLE